MKDFIKVLLALVVTVMAFGTALFFPWIMFVLVPLLVLASAAAVFLIVSQQTKLKSQGDQTLRTAVIIDDDKVVLSLLEAIFKSMGFVVKAFANPAQALNDIKGDKFEVLVVDQTMPELSGEEFLVQLNQLYETITVNGKPSVAVFTLRPNEIRLDAARLPNMNYCGVLDKGNLHQFNTKLLFTEKLGLAA